MVARVSVLFAIMSSVWGEKWTRGLDDVGSTAHSLARAEWAEGTEDLSDEQFKTGIEICRQICDYPPSIAFFRAKALRLMSPTDASDFIHHLRLEKNNNHIVGAEKLSEFSAQLDSDSPRYAVIKRTYLILERQGVFNDMSLSEQRRIFSAVYKSECDKVLANVKKYLAKS